MAHYQLKDPKVDTTDGISLNFGVWRFNVRASNTEPLLRLNIETDNLRSPRTMIDYIEELSALINEA